MGWFWVHPSPLSTGCMEITLEVLCYGRMSPQSDPDGSKELDSHISKGKSNSIMLGSWLGAHSTISHSHISSLKLRYFWWCCPPLLLGCRHLGAWRHSSYLLRREGPPLPWHSADLLLRLSLPAWHPATLEGARLWPAWAFGVQGYLYMP